MTAMADLEYGPDSSMLVEIVGDVFTGLFGERYAPPYLAAPVDTLDVSASVSVSGGWFGDVVICCSPALALSAAAELFAMAPEEVAEAEIRDVVGEFANVIGGNVKSVMPGPSVLSLPRTSLEGIAERSGDVEALRIDMTWQGEPLCVSIWTASAQTSQEGDPS